MAEKKKLPEIRFKGFSDEWENRKFSETFSNIANNTLSRAELNYNSGQGKNVHYGDVLVKFGELLDIEKDEIPFITNDVLVNKFKTSKLQDGDIIIADAAEDELVGKCTELINVGDSFVFSGLHTIPARPTQFFASKYLGYFMNSLAYHNQLLRLLQGTKVLSISKSAIKDTSILFPNDTEEQSQIGKFFQNLDKLITLHQQKYDKLVIIKKAMLEKMFPKNGEVVPEIRFKGFVGAWKEIRLGDTFLIGDIDHRMPQTVTNGIPYIMTGDFNGINEIDFENSKLISNEDYEQLSKKIKPEFGDILFARYASVGAVRYVETNKKFLVSYSCAIIKSNYSVNTKCLFYCLQSNEVQRQIELEINTGSQRNIGIDSLKKLIVFMPDSKEQQSIAIFFNNLDQLSNLHQKECYKLISIKKACLQKMFV